PTAFDFKHSDLKELEDKEIDITLHHGTIRTTEHEEIARILRKKSKVLIAFGSCSCFGGIPGLCNLTNKQQIFNTVYGENLSVANKENIFPEEKLLIDKNKSITLPHLFDTGKTLKQLVEVDYFIPGCPPPMQLIEGLIPLMKDVLEDAQLPEKGTVFGSKKTLCDECPLKKENKMISEIVNPVTAIVDPERCLLEQGILCMGPVTRGGCEAKCINVLMPCRGCMGPGPETEDQGVKMISAIASILGVKDEENLTDQQIEDLLSGIKDIIGTFYRFTLPDALLNRKVKERR
ncbi:MAG: oxidoreductase, partial [Candidatus Atribacteria bacterium]|nr:oxidoreductase [Candidatus Atribacteria bacterium]